MAGFLLSHRHELAQALSSSHPVYCGVSEKCSVLFQSVLHIATDVAIFACLMRMFKYTQKLKGLYSNTCTPTLKFLKFSLFYCITYLSVYPSFFHSKICIICMICQSKLHTKQHFISQ